MPNSAQIIESEFPATAHTAFADLRSMGWLIAKADNGMTVFHPAHGGVALLDSEEKDTPAGTLYALLDDVLKTRGNESVA